MGVWSEYSSLPDLELVGEFRLVASSCNEFELRALSIRFDDSAVLQMQGDLLVKTLACSNPVYCRDQLSILWKLEAFSQECSHCKADGGSFRNSSSRNCKPKPITRPLNGLMLAPCDLKHSGCKLFQYWACIRLVLEKAREKRQRIKCAFIKAKEFFWCNPAKETYQETCVNSEVIHTVPGII